MMKIHIDPIPLSDLGQSIQGTIIGPSNTLITGVSDLEHADSGDLVYVASSRFHEAAHRSKAAAFVVSETIPDIKRPQLLAANPLYAFAYLISHFFSRSDEPRGIAQEVSIARHVQIGEGVSIWPFVTIDAEVKIGARVTLYPGVFLGKNSVVGDDSVLFPNVTVLQHCIIGSRVTIHSGTVIGSDGFGYVQREGEHFKIPQLGHVVIEDDVELGANVTVDRATFGQTIIKRGTKVDNLVQIAHNVTIGEHSILVAQAGIAGSTSLGKQVMVGGQAGLVDHITIGDQVKIAAGSGVSRSVKPGEVVSGRPAISHETWLRSQVLLKRLPNLRQQIKELEQRIHALESQLHSTTPKTRHPRKRKKS